MRINKGYNPDDDFKPSFEGMKLPASALTNYTELIDMLPEEARMEIREITKNMALALKNRQAAIAETASELPKHVIPDGAGPTVDEIKEIAMLELLALISWSTNTAHKTLAYLVQQHENENE